MATTSLGTDLKLTPAVRALLASLRAWIRAYVWVEGLAVAATWLGVAFWGTLAIDWFFEPPAWVRKVMLAVVALVLAGVLVQLVLRRAFVRLSNGNMAMLLERRFSRFNDSLLTAVVLTERGGTGVSPVLLGCNPQMLAHTCREAAQRIGDIQLRRVFNPLPLRRAVLASVLLASSIGIFAGLSAGQGLLSGALRVWARRCLLFSDELWPRRAALTVQGFDSGVRKVARGADLEIIAHADTAKELPASVQVRYRVEGGRRDRKPMTRVGAADPAKDRFQEYSYTFQGILAPIRFDVIGEVPMGRDVSVPDLRIEVVDSPTVDAMTLHCKYPAYTGLQPRDLPVTGQVQIARGTEVAVLATANKELVGVQVDGSVGERSLPRTKLTRNDLSGDGRSFRFTLPSLDDDTVLTFTLSDTDGITGRDPVRLTLAAVADLPPQLAVQLQGIGTAITPLARLPAVGKVTDDYGIAKVWFEYVVDQQEPGAHPLTIPTHHPASLTLKDAALEVRDLKLAAGQKLLVGLKAEDLYALGKGPNVGSGERWLLDVVTPDQLRVMLESRELVLRQRFEAIIQEVSETRDLLLRMDFGAAGAPGKSGEKTAEASGTGVPPVTGEEKARKTDPGAEPGDRPVPSSPERQLAVRTLQVQRALSNSSKNAHETQSVADGFDDIRLQLVNNRIDTEELIRRLQEGIAKPLHGVAQEMFPRLQTRLERLQQSLGDETLGPERRELARQQADAILLEMRRALDRMIALEDFNEAVDLLRTIIKLQEQLDEQTKQRHKDKIRELLEDRG